MNESSTASADLAQRVSPHHLRRRLQAQGAYRRKVSRSVLRRTQWRGEFWLHRFIIGVLKSVGLYRRGERNAQRIEVRETSFRLPGLPAAFRGYRILQLSDPHTDSRPELTGVLVEKIRGMDYDLCVWTGDYRTHLFGSHDNALTELARIRQVLHSPVVAVLGNHDSIEMVPGIEALGVRVLLNESLPIRRGEDVIHLAGVDDPHMYRVHHLEEAVSGIPAGAFSILLSHAADPYRRAADLGIRLMLCGHTHGGQICFPGRWGLFHNTRTPRSMAYGLWRYRSLQGYTTSGAGTAGVPVRYNCPGEIVLHTLWPE